MPTSPHGWHAAHACGREHNGESWCWLLLLAGQRAVIEKFLKSMSATLFSVILGMKNIFIAWCVAKAT